MRKRDKLLKFIISPPKWLCIAIWVCETLALAASITLYYVGLGLKLWALSVHLVALVFFILSIYAVLTIFGIPERAKERPRIQQFFSSYDTRAYVYATCAVIFNLCYVIFGNIIAAIEHSAWLSVLVGYHVFLILARAEVLYLTKIRGRNDTEAGASEKRKLTAYMYCGVALIMLGYAFIPVIKMAIEDMNSYNYFVETVVYIAGASAFTFTKLGIAIYNLKKSRRSHDMSLIAVKNISFADALISIFALQAMMIKELSSGFTEFAASINPSVGGLIVLTILGMGLHMAIGGYKKLKALKAQQSAQAPAEETAQASVENSESGTECVPPDETA